MALMARKSRKHLELTVLVSKDSVGISGCLFSTKILMDLWKIKKSLLRNGDKNES